MEAAQASASTLVYDVTEATFDQRVIERSRELPVVVDFWAAWCGPCRQLGPLLEQAVTERAGAVELAKVDVDANQALAARYRVQGIPAVKGFRDCEPAGEFTGVVPPAQINAFLDTLAPSEGETAAAAAIASGDEQDLRRALELDPRQADVAAALARLLLRRGEAAEALALVEPLSDTDFVCGGLAARAKLELSGDAPAQAFAALDEGETERGLELLQLEVASATDAERRDLLRSVMVGMFTELGPDSGLARTHRRRLAATLA